MKLNEPIQIILKHNHINNKNDNFRNDLPSMSLQKFVSTQFVYFDRQITKILVHFVLYFYLLTYFVGFVYQQISPLLFGWITTVYFLVFPLLVYLLHFRLIFIGTDYLDMVTNAAICTRLQSTNTEDIVILSCWTHKVLKILAQFVKKTMSRSSCNVIIF